MQFFFGLQRLQQLETEVQRVHLKATRAQDAERIENTLMASLKNPDPHYLDKQVETLAFLVPEVKKLEALYHENPEDDHLFKQLHQLKEGGNRLLFAEEQIRTNDIFREMEERQQNPVEMNEEDRPQLIIKEFILSKKELPTQEKVYVVSLQLIKREHNEPPR
jgi:hypothetical protein